MLNPLPCWKPIKSFTKHQIQSQKKRISLSHPVRDKDNSYRHGGVDTPRSRTRSLKMQLDNLELTTTLIK